jgi:hypothetical protein
MITFSSDTPISRGVPELIDFGSIQRPATGAALTRIDRAGNRWKCDFTLPPMEPIPGEEFAGLLTAAKRAGLRIPFPLLADQGSPGTPVVDGAGQTGINLAVRGMTAGYQARTGFWLTVVSTATGQRYLHKLREPATADGDGKATFGIEPALRIPLANGATVQLAAPEIEGIVTSTVTWSLDTDQLFRHDFTIEEAG